MATTSPTPRRSTASLSPTSRAPRPKTSTKPLTPPTPPPLVGIFPATDSSNSPYSMISDDSRQKPARTPSPPEDYSTSQTESPSPPIRSTVGHTGASTPEDDGDRGTATVNRGTMTDFDYDEYAEEAYGRPGVSTRPSGQLSTPGAESQEYLQSSCSTNAFDAMSSYYDSDPPRTTHPRKESIHQAFMHYGIKSPEKIKSPERISSPIRTLARFQGDLIPWCMNAW